MAASQPEEPGPDRDDDLPLTDELNKRADALIARIDQHLALRRRLYHLREIPPTAVAGQEEPLRGAATRDGS